MGSQGLDRRLHHEDPRERRGGVPEEHVHPRAELLLRRLHVRTLRNRSGASQPVGNLLLFQNVPSRSKPSKPRRIPSPPARKDTPAT